MTAAKKPTVRPTSNATLARRMDAFEKRLIDVEETVGAAKLKQQRELAAKLAQNPDQLNQMERLVEMAKEAQVG